MTPDPNEYDLAVLACRPVIPNHAERDAEMAVGKSIATPYPGSVKALCEVCLREVWIGPMQQAVMQERKVQVMCLVCSVTEADRFASAHIHSLGNKHPDD